MGARVNKRKFLIYLIQKHLFKKSWKVELFVWLREILKNINSEILKFKKKRKYFSPQLILKQTKKKTIIFSPCIKWDWNFQRPQQLALELSKRGFNIIYCFQDYFSEISMIKENLYILSFRKLEELKILKEINTSIIFYTYLPSFHLNFLKIFNFTQFPIIYDCLDVLEVHGNPEIEKKAQKVLLKLAKVVITSADYLYKDIKTQRKDIILIPNGVDYNHFSSIKELSEEMKLLKKENKPIIGFYGHFGEWVDYNLIYKVSIKKSEYLFLLIGSSICNSLIKSGIIKRRNIIMFPHQNYQKLPSFSKGFDVAILPFKVNNITKGVSPVKLFEYMASGLPIVSTNIPECQKYKSVLIANSVDEFCEKIDFALTLKNNEEYRNLLKKEALENTWEKRVDEIIKKLKEVNLV